MKCLVTGATGFIGRRLCTELKASGHAVLPLSLHTATLPDGTSCKALDLTRNLPDDLMAGVDVVFHLAGIAHQKAAPEQYQALNYSATVRLAQAAAAAGVGHFVYLSSVKAMGPAVTATPRIESDCRDPEDAYGRSKWQAECALRAMPSAAAMPVSIIRPALVFGPGVKGNLRLLASAARLGLPRPPQGGRRSLIALDDLVEMLCLFVAPPAWGAGTWIASAEARSTREIFELLRRADGKGAGLSWAPAAAWRLAAALLDRVRGNTGASTYDKLFAAELYDNSALLAATGWQPSRTFAATAHTLFDRGGN